MYAVLLRFPNRIFHHAVVKFLEVLICLVERLYQIILLLCIARIFRPFNTDGLSQQTSSFK